MKIKKNSQKQKTETKILLGNKICMWKKYS